MCCRKDAREKRVPLARSHKYIRVDEFVRFVTNLIAKRVSNVWKSLFNVNIQIYSFKYKWMYICIKQWTSSLISSKKSTTLLFMARKYFQCYSKYDHYLILLLFFFFNLVAVFWPVTWPILWKKNISFWIPNIWLHFLLSCPSNLFLKKIYIYIWNKNIFLIIILFFLKGAISRLESPLCQMVHQDSDYGLFTVTLFKKVQEEFKHHAREKKYLFFLFSLVFSF